MRKKNIHTDYSWSKGCILNGSAISERPTTRNGGTTLNDIYHQANLKKHSNQGYTCRPNHFHCEGI